MALTFGSLFAGIGGFDKGFRDAGLSSRWAVDIDPACRRVLAHHWPETLLLEDVCSCGKKSMPAVDVICGGFPCQDVSVAGKRQGLAGARTGLFYEMTRIVDELQPSLLVWENVPGLLTSGGGRDFLAVLVELDRIGYSGCWTTLDARWFGVAQRRRRLFGVFARRDTGIIRAAEILALAHRRQGHFAKGCETKPDRTPTVASGARRKSGGEPFGVSDKGSSTWVEGRPTLSASDDNGTNHLVVHTLTAEGCDASEDGMGRGTPLVVAFKESQSGIREADVHATLDANKGSHRQEGVRSGMMVRRLMPVECCRLQGFGDDWLDLEPPLSDSAKYRMLGNAVCVSVARWLGSKIMERLH